MTFAKPTIYASKCLGFDACWWNGQMMHSDFIESIRPFVDFVTHCPEVEIGLGAPRPFVRIVLKDDKRMFLQPSTNRDLTKIMNDYVERLTSQLEHIDGFVLKEGSPSCSIGRVRYYAGPEKGANIVTEGPGFLGGAIIHKLKGIPVESDGRLRNARLRETFLTKIFLLGDLRRVIRFGKMRDLIEFHSKNKYLIMGFGQKYSNQLGRILSNSEKNPFDVVSSSYMTGMKEVMGITPRSTSIINALMKIYGYFSESLTKKERDQFHDRVASFRKGTTSLTALRELLRIWAVRFDESYVEGQTIFQPFPEELNSICDVVAFKKER